MKVGLVGVGPWGRTIARKLKKLGHEVAYHCRGSGTAAPEMGELVDWKKMPGLVPAVIVAAPPQVTKEVAYELAKKCIPVLATKPFLGAEEILSDIKWKGTPFAVDYVHLHSPLMKKLMNEIDEQGQIGVTAKNIECQFYGDGPVRSFSPLLDYGPHALTAAFELLSTPIMDVERVKVTSSRKGRETWTIEVDIDGVEGRFVVGNDAPEDTHASSVVVTFSNGNKASYSEQWPKARFESSSGTAEETGDHDPLAELLKTFLWHAEERTSAAEDAARCDLELSADVEEVLSKIQQVAAAGR